MKRVGLLLLVACNRTQPQPQPQPQNIADAVSPPSSFDPGTPPANKSLYVIAEGGHAGSLSASLFRYDGRAAYELGADLLRNPSLDLEPKPAERAVASSGWKDGSTLRVVAGAKLGAPFVFLADKPVMVDLPNAIPGDVRDMSALSSGEVFAIVDEKLFAWPAGKKDGAVVTLPSRKDRDPPRLTLVHARSPNEVWVGGFDFEKKEKDPRQRPYFASFDGATWKTEDIAWDGFASALTSGADGTIWAVAGNRLLRREKPGPFVPSTIPFPTDGAIEPVAWVERDGLRAIGPRDVWIVVRCFSRYIVVHTKPGNGVLDLDDGTRMTFAQAEKRWFLPLAWDP